jgi:hypothetical protein
LRVLEDETGALSLLVVLPKEVKTPLLQGFEGRVLGICAREIALCMTRVKIEIFYVLSPSPLNEPVEDVPILEAVPLVETDTPLPIQPTRPLLAAPSPAQIRSASLLRPDGLFWKGQKAYRTLPHSGVSVC